MKLGENILKLRKNCKLSQEQLAEKVNVTRQTISNWELGETSPNPEQLKLLSKELNVSIDELLENDIKNVLETKVSNTERLAGVIIKILKVMGILLALYFVIAIVSFILFGTMKKTTKEVETTTSVSLVCTLDGKTYDYYMEDENDKLIDYNGSEFINILVKDKNFANSRTMVKYIQSYFKDNGGSCK